MDRGFERGAIRPGNVEGAAEHVAGTDRTALEAAIHRADCGSLSWREVEPRLEDVFIHMLSQKGEEP